MSSYNACPHCGRKAQKAISSNHFAVRKCKACGKVFCSKCGPPCPQCGGDKSSECGKVYA